MKLKFMGTADVKEVRKGDDFGGVLSEGIGTDVVWSRENGWVVDTSQSPYDEIPDEAWEYLIINDNFLDVTEFVRVPLNEHQKTFLGMREGQQRTIAEEEEARVAALDAAFEQARQQAAAANAREEVIAKIRNSEATRTELMDIAKDYNVKGRSKMSVPELQEALSDALYKEAGTEAPSSEDPANVSSTVSDGVTTTGGSTT